MTFTTGSFLALTENDLAAPKNPQTSAPAKAKHRQVAQLMVMGRFTNAEIGRLVGYSPQHISKLLRTPEFRRLLERYEFEREQRNVDLRSELLKLTRETVAGLRYRVRVDEPIPSELRKLLCDALDRCGLPPVRRRQIVEVRAGPDIGEMKAEVAGTEADHIVVDL